MKYFIIILILFTGFRSFAQENAEVLDVYMGNHQYTKALSYISEQEPTKELELRKALCYKGLGNYSEAKSILLPLSGEYPDDKRIISELALCYQFLSDWEAGLGCYDRLIGLDTTNVYYKIQKADMQFRKADYKTALASYQELSGNYHLDNMVKRSAQCFENMNIPDSAIVYYKAAWGIDSTDTFSVASLINLNIKQGNEKLNDAMNYADIYIRRDSTNKQINLLDALSYYAANMYEQAAERFEKCYAAGDSSLILNRSLGISYYSLGMNIMAQPFLMKAYEQDSTNNNVLYCLGVVSNEMADYKNAVKYFSTLLKRTIPSDLTLFLYYRGLATGYNGNKDSREAVENFRIAEKYAGTNQKMNLFYDIAVLYDYDLGMSAEALEYYNKYKESLNGYLQRLREKENPDERDSSAIKDVENKISNLSSHIERLERKNKITG